MRCRKWLKLRTYITDLCKADHLKVITDCSFERISRLWPTFDDGFLLSDVVLTAVTLCFRYKHAVWRAYQLDHPPQTYSGENCSYSWIFKRMSFKPLDVYSKRTPSTLSNNTSYAPTKGSSSQLSSSRKSSMKMRHGQKVLLDCVTRDVTPSKYAPLFCLLIVRVE